MKSLRLNKQLRNAIVESFAAKREASNPPPEVTVTRQSISEDLAYYCYEKAYGAIDLSGVPEDMLYLSDSILVRFPVGEGSEGDNIQDLYFKEIEKYVREKLPVSRRRRVEYELTKSEEGYKKYKKDMKLLKQEQQAAKEYKAEHDRYIQQVRQVVEAVNTTKQLLEVWPEAEQFIPEDIRDPSTITLPSVNIADLNKQVQVGE